MGAAEDIVNAKIKKPGMGYAESVKVAEAPNTPPGNPKIISGSKIDPNNPDVLRGDKTGAWKGAAPDAELNWVQKMTKQIHDYLTRKKKENK